MNATDYIVNAILVLLVLRQIRETRLTWQILLLPVLIVVGVACYYLRSVPTAGNDLLLVAIVTRHPGALYMVYLAAMSTAASASLRLRPSSRTS